jgi:hypothetical protein
MDRPLESIFREHRPEPPPGFVEALEARLVDEVGRARRPVNPLRASVALTAGLATTLVVLGLSGLLPWNLGAVDRGEAKLDCTTVVTVRMERRPTVVAAKTGELRLHYRVTPVRHSVRRCHAPGGGSTPP